MDSRYPNHPNSDVHFSGTCFQNLFGAGGEVTDNSRHLPVFSQGCFPAAFPSSDHGIVLSVSLSPCTCLQRAVTLCHRVGFDGQQGALTLMLLTQVSVFPVEVEKLRKGTGRSHQDRFTAEFMPS